MFQESSNKEKSEQPISFPMCLLLIFVAAIPSFLLSSLYSFHTGTKASFKASILPHISTKESLRPVEKKQLDCVIHAGVFKTSITSVQGTLGWNLHENLVNRDYYFPGKNGGMANMRK
jgi:hypothetical protein